MLKVILGVILAIILGIILEAGGLGDLTAKRFPYRNSENSNQKLGRLRCSGTERAKRFPYRDPKNLE